MASLGSERDDPLYFAGRREELSILDERVEYLLNHPDRTKGGLVLIDGIQGIGKTQLAHELARRWSKINPKVLHLAMTTKDLAVGDDQLVAELTSLLPARNLSAAHWLDEAKRHFEQMPFRIQLRQRGNSLRSMLARTKTDGWWDGHVLIATVDEIQSVSAEGRSLLKVLHEGVHQCPILLIGMGLQHSTRVLANEMANSDGTPNNDAISRFGSHLTLGMLSRDETAEAVVLGVEASDAGTVPVSLALEIADETKGFPQHIHGYIRGCIGALEQYGSLEPEEARQHTLSRGREGRRRYYKERLDSMRDEHQPSIQALAKAMPENGDSVNAMDAERIMASSANESGVSTKQTIAEAIEKGVLTRTIGGLVSFPIPSLRGYAAALAETVDSRSKCLGDD